MDTHSKLSKIDGDLHEDGTSYRRLIGRLLYLTHTRHNITYLVHYLSQFLDAPRVLHLHTPIQILNYVKMSPGQGIFFPNSFSIHLKGLLTQIGLVIMPFLDIYLFHESPRNNQQFINLVQNVNID